MSPWQTFRRSLWNLLEIVPASLQNKFQHISSSRSCLYATMNYVMIFAAFTKWSNGMKNENNEWMTLRSIASKMLEFWPYNYCKTVSFKTDSFGFIRWSVSESLSVEVFLKHYLYIIHIYIKWKTCIYRIFT